MQLGHLMPAPERRQKIEEAFAATGETLLRPVREMLGEDYSYVELNLVRIGMHQKQSEVHNSLRRWGDGPQG